MWLHYLPVCSLHDQAFASMQDPIPSQLGSCSTPARTNSFASRFNGNDLYSFFFQEMIKSTSRITSPAYTGNYVCREFRPGLVLKLPPDLLADHALEPSHHIRIR